MSEYPTSPEISFIDDYKLESGSLDFYSGIPFGPFTRGDLCSVNDVDIGNATDFPLTAANKADCVQYLRDVKQMTWSLSYSYDDGAGNTESANVGGTNYLAPLFYDETSLPSTPGLEVRRRMMGPNAGAIQLALRPAGFETFYMVFEDAVSRTNSGGPLFPVDLEIRFILFGNLSTFNRFTNVAHDPSNGEYYPKLYFLTRRTRSFSDLGNVAGTATVEDLGSCNLYASDAFTTCNFTATIASRFTDP